ncbi:ferredoxin [Streptomyces sp. SAS_270]|uniref:ferredoxin n=1 Tax=Streptomyces sp. SAS_270 TaxID=3412748 RepID=UPI00403C2D77
MKVSVDPGLCYGSAECVHRVPSVFAFKDGYGTVRPGREDTEDDPLIREAAERCPSQAITLAVAE